MKVLKTRILSFTCIFAMLCIILENDLVKAAGKDGVSLCLETVIPSLFPFFCLSSPLLSVLLDSKIKVLHFLRQICKIPEGSEGIILIGFLGGYPMGAKAIGDAYQCGAISKYNSERMLAFCSNCGPAFLFGIVAGLFPSPYYVSVLWIIHMLSAMSVAYIFPDLETTAKIQHIQKPENKGILGAITAMLSVCAYVILFRILLEVLKNRVFIFWPEIVGTIISGMIELTNGILSLHIIESLSFRFLLATIFVNFGGICVVMQTASVIGTLKIRSYLVGKVIQSAFSIAFSVVFLILMRLPLRRIELSLSAFVIFTGLICFLIYRKKAVEFPNYMMYNTDSIMEMGKDHAVS